MNNFISLYGEVLDYPQQASIDKKGTEYYKFNLAVQRESGIIDILPIVVEEDTAAYNALADIDEKGEVVGAQLLIAGEIRTRNIKDKLDISVRAFSIQEDDDYKGITNQVVITGFLCKEVPIRETPRGLADCRPVISGTQRGRKPVKRLYPVYHVERHSHQGNGKTACRGLYRSRRALTEPRVYKRLRGQGKRA